MTVLLSVLMCWGVWRNVFRFVLSSIFVQCCGVLILIVVNSVCKIVLVCFCLRCCWIV